MNVIGTAGHVDHGKSSLVHRLTGIDPDRLADEKRRGMTLDLGFAWLRLPSGNEAGLIDVPGHEKLVRTMLAGTGGISICLFVVAANEGWKPQSAEHLAILHTLDVRAGVVALTKSDTVDEAAVDEVSQDIARRLEPSSLAGAPIMPCSAATGDGLDRLLAALDRIVAATPPAPDRGRARLWIDRSFSMRGSGTVVTGTLTGGRLARGDEIELLPQRRRARIRAIQTHKTEVEELGPGTRCALNLVGPERTEVRRGDVATRPAEWTLTRRIDARISVPPREISGVDVALTERGSHLIYVGSSETSARIRLLDADRIRAGETGRAQIVLTAALPLARGDRFVVRDAGPGVTVGGGMVIDPHPAAARRGDSGRLALLDRMEGDAAGALRALVEHTGTIDAREAESRTGTGGTPEGVLRLGTTFASQSRADELSAALVEILRLHHTREPLSAGIPREEARTRLGLEAAAFDDLVALSRVRDVDGRLSLSDHLGTAAAETSEAGRKLVAELDSAGFQPPLERDLDADPALVRALVQSGAVVRIGDFLLTRSRAAEAADSVRSKIRESGPVTVAGVRDLLGTSRKYAVPLCEWLDATGVTVRDGDLRGLARSAKAT